MNNLKIKALLTEIATLIEESTEAECVTITRAATHLVIKSHDEPEKMSWNDAVDKFGENGTDKEWRLPTRAELNLMYEQKDNIPNLDLVGGADPGLYWSSSEYNSYYAWYQRFRDGYQYYSNKTYLLSLRCTRR